MYAHIPIYRHRATGPLWFQALGKFLILFSVGGLAWFELLLSSSRLHKQSQLLTLVERHSARCLLGPFVQVTVCSEEQGSGCMVKAHRGCRELTFEMIGMGWEY